MGKLVTSNGDLLTVETQYIAHRCHCVTTRGTRLSAALFRRFPWADTYTTRQQPSPPGTEVFGDGRDQRFVINIYAQYSPGRPRKGDDSAEVRRQWFAVCLRQISALPGLCGVAFPYLIGWGLAGGDWAAYSAMLGDWAEAAPAERVLLVKKE